MPTPKVYLIDENKNLVEVVNIEDNLFRTRLEKLHSDLNNTDHSIEFVTQAQYNQLEAQGQLVANTYYFITDDTTAEDTNNKISELENDIADLRNLMPKQLYDITADNYFELTKQISGYSVVVVVINYKETASATEGTATVVLTRTPITFQGNTVVIVNGTPKTINYMLPLKEGYGELIPTTNTDGTLEYTSVLLYAV